MYATDGNVACCEYLNVVVRFHLHEIVGRKSVSVSALRLLNTDKTCEHKNHNVVPRPKQRHRAHVRQSHGLVENKSVGDAKGIHCQIKQENSKNRPLNNAFASIATFSSDLKFLTLWPHNSRYECFHHLGSAQRPVKI